MKQNYVTVTLCIENAIHENEHAGMGKFWR